MADKELHLLLERLGTLLGSELRQTAAREDLKEVQLQALHYLASCNRYSNTPAGVTEFLALTKGTVSQTLRALESKGLVEKRADAEDARVVRLRLTRHGKATAKRTFPLPVARELAEELGKSGTASAEAELRGVLTALQRARDHRSFGVCRTCAHFRKDGKDSYRCGLTGETLLIDETSLLCREHQPRDAA